jgi:hypothetical protein
MDRYEYFSGLKSKNNVPPIELKSEKYTSSKTVR